MRILLTLLFVWLCIKVVGIFFALAGGVIKVVLGITLTVVFPFLLGCLFFATGIVLCIPVVAMVVLLFSLEIII